MLRFKWTLRRDCIATAHLAISVLEVVVYPDRDSILDRFQDAMPFERHEKRLPDEKSNVHVHHTAK